jgi:putative membrane protein
MYWHHHYMDMGDGAWIIMAVFWIALLAVLVWAVTRIFPSGSHSRPEPPESPEDILARRLASGEIDAATDRLRKKLLERR